MRERRYHPEPSFKSPGVRSYKQMIQHTRNVEHNCDIHLAIMFGSGTILGDQHEGPGSGRTRSQDNQLFQNVPQRIVHEARQFYYKLGDVAKIHFISC